ncbi:MAG TPA: peptide ABC transporter substrate-binding protein [Chloroflexota bacterium]
MTFAVEGEPGNLAIPSMGGVAVGTTGGGDLKLAVHQRLATYDDHGELHPALAAELPSQDRGTWLVRTDGTMQTTYKLRPGITWHDGTPLSSKDFAFVWTVTSDPEVPMSTRLSTQISRIDTPDDLTLIYEWASTYPLANALIDDELAPLPRHLLQSTYEADKDRFQNLGYWTREFVGVGPYRVASWEAGSSLNLEAYDGFYAGRPHIDRLIVRFFADSNAVVSNLLAGALDGTLARALDLEQTSYIEDQWRQAGKKFIFVAQTTHWRLLEVQLRPDLARPADIIDPRIRQGLLQAIDRQALVDTVLRGQAPVSDTFIPPDDAKWAWVHSSVATYPFDPKRAQERLRDAGWQQTADGQWLDRLGNRISVPLHTRPDPQGEREISIIAGNWRSLGLGVEQVVWSVGEARDNKVIATYPGFAPTSNPLAFGNTLQVMYGRLCPSEQTRWSGRNHGCYQNPEMDRVIDGLNRAIDPADQQRLWSDMVRIQTQELPVLPLYFNIQAVLFREGVTGVKGDTKPRTSSMWDVADWDITS